MRVDSVGRWEIAQTGKMHDVYGAAFEDSVFSPEAPIYWTRIPSDLYQCRHCGNWHMTSVLERGNRSLYGVSNSAKNSKITRLLGGKRQRRKKPMRKMRKF